MQNNIILLGNPNVGKSTIFNKLTGLHQHTGNWPGKTVEVFSGKFKYKSKEYHITDLPGTYSFFPASEDERVTCDFVMQNSQNLCIVVCNALAIERGLILALQAMDLCQNVIICINLIDEAERKGVVINTGLISERLGIPVIETSIKDRTSKKRLLEEIYKFSQKTTETSKLKTVEYYVEKAEEICHGAIKLSQNDIDKTDRKIDRIVMGKYSSVLILAILLCLIFYLTITFAGYPSQLLSDFFEKVHRYIDNILSYSQIPTWLSSMISDGLLNVLFWVVSVMLPPMIIFFPLFALLEDSGYLPRVAYLTDNVFKKCGSCGKQTLTMCMGLGCTCAGVSGCRIFSGEKEKIIATITNSLTPCNGKFPALFLLINIFIVTDSGFLSDNILGSFAFCMIILISFASTYINSFFISKKLFKDSKTPFCLELPSYRKPDFRKIISHSIVNKVFKILSRAIIVSAPAGILIWCLTHIDINEKSLFFWLTQLLDPFGKLLGLDGTILSGFILGFPANEIIMPIIIMGYQAKETLTNFDSLFELKKLLTDNGWNILTAINTIILTLFHWPCSTAVLTIKKETASLKWTAISIVIPTATGFLLCFITNVLFRLVCTLTN